MTVRTTEQMEQCYGNGDRATFPVDEYEATFHRNGDVSIRGTVPTKLPNGTTVQKRHELTMQSGRLWQTVS